MVRRCLEKSAEQRFQSARDLAFALGESSSASIQAGAAGRTTPALKVPVAIAVGLLILAIASVVGFQTGWIRERLTVAWAPSGIRSLAVLPLQNLSGDARQDYFVDGMTDALTASLAQIHSIKVISRTSSMLYKGSKKPLRDIARELHVDAVVEGSFARSGDRLRVTARLIRGQTDAQFWAKSFERQEGDILILQGEIARVIAEQIEAEVTADERSRLGTARPVVAKAYEAYLLGRYALDEGTEESMNDALKQFSRALEIQNDYAAASAGIASYYSILPFYSSFSPAEVFPKARAAAEKSVQLDDRLAEAHASLAYIRAYYEWDWAGAEREFRRALDLSPNFADGHFSYSRFLAASGRMEEAVTELRRTEELDPRSLPLKANLSLLSYFQGHYDDALTTLLEISRADSTISTATWGIGLSYEQKGMGPQALASLEKAAQLSGSLNVRASLAHAYAVFGNQSKARKILSTLTEQSRRSYVPSYYFVLIHTGLGEEDRAFEWLERTYQERSTVLAYLRLDPRLAPLRSDPRYTELVRRLGFPS